MQTEPIHTTVLDVLTAERDSLIRAECRIQDNRERFEQGIRDAVVKCGATVDEVSAATGLTPTEVRSIAARPESLHALIAIS